MSQELSTHLPLKRNLSLIFALSYLIALLMATASVAGLLYTNTVYPTDELLLSFLPVDIAILFIGLPMLLGSMWLTRRGKLIGLLFWPGALFFVFYNYIINTFALPLTEVFLLYLALVTLSAYCLIGLVASIDGKIVQQGLANVVPERLSGGILASLGLLFLLQVISALISALTSQTRISEIDFVLHITDFMIAPAWVICGVLLWRRKEFGYVTGLGLLFQASMLFIGLIIVLVVQPFISSVPFAIADVVLTFAMGLICFIPLVLFAGAVVSGDRAQPK